MVLCCGQVDSAVAGLAGAVFSLGGKWLAVTLWTFGIRLSVSFAEFTPSIRKALNKDREALIVHDADVAKLETKFADEQNVIAMLTRGETKDIVDLDVSGEVMSVKRSTLMLCAESALARQFDDAVWAQPQPEGSDRYVGEP